MAYTNSFDPTTPLDSSSVSEGDDEIRKIKAAVIERLETIVQDFDADPLVIKPALLTGSDHDTASYVADNAANTRASVIAEPAIILFLKVTGTTDTSGSLVVDFDETNFDSKYDLTKLQTIFASLREGASTGTRVSTAAGNQLTLDSDYTAATAVIWDVLLVFSDA